MVIWALGRAGEAWEGRAAVSRVALLGMFRKSDRPYGKSSKPGILCLRFPKIARQPR